MENIIVVYDYAFINGGAAKVAIRSAVGLSDEGYHVSYYCAVGPVCEELSESSVNVRCLDIDDINSGNRIKAMMNGIWNQNVYRDFLAFLKDFDRDQTIIHVHGWSKALSSAVLKAAEKMRFQIVLTLHDYFTLCPNGGFYNYNKKYICQLKPMSMKCMLCDCDKRNYLQKIWRTCRQLVQDRFVRADKNINYISISGLNENLIKDHVRSNRFYRVNNPIDLADCQISNIEDNKVYLYVGRVSEEKGVELFCETFTAFSMRNPGVEGVVVGDGPLLRDLKEKYHDIEFVGWKPAEQVKEYMLKARALVFPSKWYEGAPLTIAEAMSAGLPCIVSDCTSAAEMIADGLNGFVFQAEDSASLMKKMEMMLNDTVAVRINHCLCSEFLTEEHSLTAHVKKLIRVYLQIMDLGQRKKNE